MPCDCAAREALLAEDVLELAQAVPPDVDSSAGSLITRASSRLHPGRFIQVQLGSEARAGEPVNGRANREIADPVSGGFTQAARISIDRTLETGLLDSR